MKILYVITLANWGGAQAQLFDLVKYANEEGHESVVVVGEHGELVERLQEIGVKVIVASNLKREIHVKSDLMCVRELVKLIKIEKPDIVHTHSSKAGIVGRIAAKLTNTPNVFTAHGWAFTEGVDEKKRKLYIFIERLVSKITNQIICVSNYDRNLALQNKVGDSRKNITIHNGVREQKNRNIVKNSTNVLKIIMVARFSPPKDYEMLIKSLMNVKGDFEAYFVGGGELLPSMQMLAANCNMDSKIKFLGERNDVDQLLSNSDIFVLTSNYEGLPISIIEAMSKSLPVIATNVGGVNELVDEGKTGYLIRRKDINGLTKKLQLLIDDENKRNEMGIEGYQKFKQEFTLATMLNHTFNVYNDVLK